MWLRRCGAIHVQRVHPGGTAGQWLVPAQVGEGEGKGGGGLVPPPRTHTHTHVHIKCKKTWPPCPPYPPGWPLSPPTTCDPSCPPYPPGLLPPLPLPRTTLPPPYGHLLRMQYAMLYPTNTIQPSDQTCNLAGMTCPQYKAANTSQKFFCNSSSSK